MKTNTATRWHDNQTGWEEHPAGTPVEIVSLDTVTNLERRGQLQTCLHGWNVKRKQNWVAVRIAGFVGCVDRKWVE